MLTICSARSFSLYDLLSVDWYPQVCCIWTIINIERNVDPFLWRLQTASFAIFGVLTWPTEGLLQNMLLGSYTEQCDPLPSCAICVSLMSH